MSTQRSKFTRILLPLCSFCLLIGPLPQQGLAQEQRLIIEEVQVTARKREESLQDVPLTVSAFTEQDLENRAPQSIDDIARYAAGLSFSKAFGRDTERPVIRGLGNVLAGVQFGVESGAAYFIDGFYYSGEIQSLNLGEVRRVEVIKGPQSALYGRNTYSGAINFVTRGAPEEFSSDLYVSYIPDDTKYEVRLNVGGPLTDNIRGAVFLRTYEFDGEGEWVNQVTGQQVGDESTNAFSGVLDWDLSDSSSVRLRAQLHEDDDGTRPFFLQPASENNCFPGYRSLRYRGGGGTDTAFTDNQYFCGAVKNRPIALNDRADADGEPNLVAGVPNRGFNYNLADGTPFDGVDREVQLFSFLYTNELEDGYVFKLAGSFRYEEERTGSDSTHDSVNLIFGAPGVASALFSIANRRETYDRHLEMRFDTPRDNAFRMSWGLYLYDQDLDQYELSFADTTVGAFDSKNTIENRALFASGEYDFSEQLTASLELRLSEETKETDDAPFAAQDTWENFTPRLTVSYRVHDDLMVYGLYAEGYKAGGFNGSQGASVGRATYDQEDSENLEFGVKTTMWDGRMQINAAVFFNDVTDVQLTTPIADPDGALNSIATNQGSGEVLGLEFELRALLTDSLRLQFNYALADSEFTEGCDEFQWSLTSGGGRYNFSDPASSFDPPNLGGTGDCSIVGKQFPLSSEHQASLALDWSQPLGNVSQTLHQRIGDAELFAGVDVTYESKKYAQVHNLAYVDAVTLFGARIGLRFHQLEVSIFGRNLGDDDTPVLITRWLQLGNGGNSAVGDPDPRDDTRTLTSNDVDAGSPRAFFSLPREGQQLGAELRWRF